MISVADDASQATIRSHHTTVAQHHFPPSEIAADACRPGAAGRSLRAFLNLLIKDVTRGGCALPEKGTEPMAGWRKMYNTQVDEETSRLPSSG